MFRSYLRLFGILFSVVTTGILSAGVIGRLFPGEQISYVGQAYLAMDIFLFDLQTQVRFNLTHSPVEEEVGHWSPDGTRLAYTVNNNEDQRSDLIIRDVFRGETQRFTIDGLIYSVDWSPNGTELAINVEAEIHILDLETSEERFLTNGYVPDWSPDGQKIIFYQFASVSPQADVLIINLDGGDRRRLMETHLNETFPIWSPDGTRIAFNRWTDTTGGEIFLMSSQCVIDDTDCNENTEQLTRDNRLKTSLAWSPDGESILYFTEFPDGSSNVHREISRAFVTDGRVAQLTHTESDEYSPAWWPFRAQTLPALNLHG